MEEEADLDLLTAGTKRITSRKRAQPRSHVRKEVESEILPSNLPNPVFGCNLEIFDVKYTKIYLSGSIKGKIFLNSGLYLRISFIFS